jgi:hypothetical protein
MSPDGKVRVVVRSRRVPARLVELRETAYSQWGIPIGTRTDRRVVYDYVLDEDHQRTIEEARKFARSLCLDLEIVDSGRLGFFGRLLLSLGRRGAGNPTVVVSPALKTMAPDASTVLTRR